MITPCTLVCNSYSVSMRWRSYAADDACLLTAKKMCATMKAKAYKSWSASYAEGITTMRTHTVLYRESTNSNHPFIFCARKEA